MKLLKSGYFLQLPLERTKSDTMLLGGGGAHFRELHAVSSEIILVWGQVSEE